jgi:hypothetical protein
MRKLLLVVALFLTIRVSSQTYIQYSHQISNTIGTLGEKTNIAIELGKQWDVFSLGLDLGKTNLVKSDTSLYSGNYIEIRPNLNIFQQGKFTNTFTAGIGYVFGAKENLMTELTSGIEYAYTNNLHINVNFGQYYYNGRFTTESVTFFGIGVAYYFTPYKMKNSSLIK